MSLLLPHYSFYSSILLSHVYSPPSLLSILLFYYFMSILSSPYFSFYFSMLSPFSIFFTLLFVLFFYSIISSTFGPYFSFFFLFFSLFFSIFSSILLFFFSSFLALPSVWSALRRYPWRFLKDTSWHSSSFPLSVVCLFRVIRLFLWMDRILKTRHRYCFLQMC